MTATNPGIANLVSWWSFDEASGNANDSHGTNHLTETSGTIQSAAGKVGTARDIERGDSEWFAVADNDSIDLGGKDFSTGVWFKAESWATTFNILVNKRGSSDNIEFQITAVNGRVSCTVYDSVSAGFITSIHESADIKTGVWQFVVLTYDNTAKKVGCYWNGIGALVTKAGMNVVSGDSALVFGTSAWNLGAAATTHDGLLDEGFLFTKNLSLDEVTWLYNGGDGRSYAEVAEITDDAFLMNWW